MQAPGQVQRSSGGGSEGSGESLGGFGAEPGQVQQGFGEGSEEGLHGAEPGQVQQGFGEGFGEGSRKPWCKARFNRVLEKFPEKVGEALVQSQVMFQGAGEGSGEGLGGFGAEPGQVQQGSGEGSGEGLGGFMVQRRFRRRSGRLWCKARPDSTGFRRRFRRRFPEKVPEKVLEKIWEALVQPGQVQQRSGEGSSAWLRSTLQKDL